VNCGRIDIAKIIHDRDQLWGEAAQGEAKGENVYTTAREMEDALKAAQEQREITDEWNHPVAEWLEKQSGRVRLVEVAENALDVSVDRFDPVTQKRVAECVRNAGWKCHISGGRGYWTKKGGSSGGSVG
jgi:predicted P-loop ATPase